MGKSAAIKVDDVVRVVNPLIIQRVGYDYTFEDAWLESQVEYKEEIYALLRKAKVSRWNIVEKAIVSSLAYDRVKKKFKDGNERKIYTKLKESLRDRQVTVVSKKTAKTGIYYPPYHGNGYDDYDGEPGGLTDGKTHILLEIDVFDEEGRIWIEQTNVVKL